MSANNRRSRIHDVSPVMANALRCGTSATASKEPARNFAREHMRALRETQQRHRLEKAAESEPPPEPFKLAQFKRVPSKVGEMIRAPSAPRPETPPKEFLRRGSGENRATEARAKAVRAKFSIDSAEERKARRESLPAKSPLPKDRAELAPRSGTDFVTQNRLKALETPKKTSPRSPSENLPERPESYGQVPKYLVERKEEWAAEEEARRAAAPDPNCPPGMRVLPEDERLETLRLLDESEKEAQKNLSRLPLVIQTPSMQRYHDQQEARLREIESAKGIFSRSKVYVVDKGESKSGSGGNGAAGSGRK